MPGKADTAAVRITTAATAREDHPAFIDLRWRSSLPPGESSAADSLRRRRLEDPRGADAGEAVERPARNVAGPGRDESVVTVEGAGGSVALDDSVARHVGNHLLETSPRRAACPTGAVAPVLLTGFGAPG